MQGCHKERIPKYHHLIAPVAWSEMPTLKQQMATAAPSSWYPTKGSTVGETHKLKKSDFIMFKIMTAKEFGHKVGHRPTHFIAFPSNHHTSLDRKWRRQHLDRLAKRTAWWTNIRHVPLGITLKNTVEELMRDSQYYLLGRILVMSSNSDSKLLLTSYNKKDSRVQLLKHFSIKRMFL